MTIYLIDNFETKEIEEIKRVVPKKETEVYEIGLNCLVEKINLAEQVCVIACIRCGFLSNECFSLLKNIAETGLKNTQINIIFIENMYENAKIAIEWLNFLRTEYSLKINIVGEINRQNMAVELESVTALSTNKVQANEIKDNNVTIYTDGACSGNPGAGGWGAILMHGNYAKEISGFEKETTNNRMELTAVIVALSTLKQPCTVELYSDSAYVVNAIKQGWLENWKKNGWVGSDKKQVKNIELWQSLDVLMQKHNVNFNKVKGHADNEFNNRCDALATGEIAKHAND